MFSLTTQVHVDGLTAKDVIDFLAGAGDDEYRSWWPGTHLAYHTTRGTPGTVGSEVYFDEYVGKRRLRLSGVVTQALPGNRLALQLKRGVRLPAWLDIEVDTDESGVTVTHTLRAGWLLGPYLSRGFRDALDEHVRTEFKRLGELLSVDREAPSTEA